MRKALLFSFFLFSLSISISGICQSLGDTLLYPDITEISLTRQGQILVSDRSANIRLLDSLGKTVAIFSPRRPARIHLLEGWNGLRPFAFYRDFQEYVILDRFLLSDGPSALNPEKTGYARLLAPGLDGNLWLLDESNFQLVKIDPRNQNTLFSTPLDLLLSGKQYDMSFMREYQNQLYIADKMGRVLLFDQMGNFRKKLPIENCAWLGFMGDEIYSVENDSLTFFHPRLFRKRKFPLPFEARGANRVVLTRSFFYWLSKEGLHRSALPCWVKEI